MSEKYKIKEPDRAYFVTLTTVGWIDLFTRKEIKQIVIDSIKYCQVNKGLILFGWCLMPSHLHMLCQSVNEHSLSDILRDLKKHTSRQIVKFIKEGNESRREWLLEYFSKVCPG